HPHPRAPALPTRRSSDLWIRRWNAGRNWRTWPAEPASGALYRLGRVRSGVLGLVQADRNHVTGGSMENVVGGGSEQQREAMSAVDRKSTRLNSSHVKISY